MNLKIFAIGIAASLALAAPAMAFNRTGTTHFQTWFGDVSSSFEESYDAADGNFSRTGHITTATGLAINYAFSGSCAAPGAGCDFNGSGTGPFGGKWRIQGTLKREADGVHLSGKLMTPDGQTIDFDRQAGARSRLRQQRAQ